MEGLGYGLNMRLFLSCLDIFSLSHSKVDKKAMPEFVIAIDIGNTRTHIGIIDTVHRTCLKRDDLPVAVAQEEISNRIDLLKSKAVHGVPLPIVIAGGGDRLGKKIEALLRAGGTEHIHHLSFNANMPITLDYDNPEHLGADRIADALYAATVWPNKNVIILGSGTAITVNLLDNAGRFRGGIIMPGIGAQFVALHSLTRSLPLLYPPEGPLSLMGKSTETCIQAGIMHGIAGALNHFVSRFAKSLNNNFIIAATGGSWKDLERFVDFSATFVPDMTLVGTALWLG
jgi:pantothenate kinase type III